MDLVFSSVKTQCCIHFVAVGLDELSFFEPLTS